MLKAIFNFFKKPVAPTAPTPYKVETPAEKPKAKKPAVKKATTKKPAVAAKTARKSRAPKA